MKVSILVIVGLFFLAGCAGSTSFVNTANLPDNYQCNYMKDVCKEAQEFEAKYAAMNPEEKNEFKTLLMTYRKQCSSALDECQTSAKER
jgi:hypothetical protein